MGAPTGPLMHASQFCDAFRLWARTVAVPLPTDDEGVTKWRKSFAESWGQVELAIVKSCLLDRLIYCADPLRTEPCPVHKGRWSGITREPCSHCGGPCGCNTGWLPAVPAAS